MPGTFYGLSNKGWVDMELFRVWLSDHFLEYAVGVRPLLVLLYSHSSHYHQPDLIRFARDHDIICDWLYEKGPFGIKVQFPKADERGVVVVDVLL